MRADHVFKVIDLHSAGAPHPLGRSVRLPSDPHRDVYTAVRLGAETRPVLVELRSVLAEVAMRLSAVPDP